MFSQSDHEEKKNLLPSIPSCLGLFKLPAVHPSPSLDTVQRKIHNLTGPAFHGKSNGGYIL